MALTEKAMSPTQRAQKKRVEGLLKQRGYCAEPGPYGYVCTLPQNHPFSCYDGSEDASFNYRWMEDMNPAGTQHPYDCKCEMRKNHTR
jgi:hypothetical protein